jgi:GNAT superfamily N-acetyltransferase
MTPVQVRFAAPDQLDTAHGLLTAQLVEHGLPVDALAMTKTLKLIVASGSSAWLVMASRDAQVVGICLANRILSVEKGGPVIWIEELYVVPAARRTGVANEILGFISAQARTIGARALELEVVPTQAAAFALYDHLGFRRLDRQRLSLDL